MENLALFSSAMLMAEGSKVLEASPNSSSSFLTFLFYFVIVLIVAAAGMIGLSAILGPRKDDPEKLSVYECGVPPVGSPRERIPIKFYVIGMLFIVFDIEVVFMYPWASYFFSNKLLQQAPKGFVTFGLVEMVVFIAILLVGYIYAWKKGALKWE